MRTRIAHLALTLYPLAFRERYGAEMHAHLEDEPAGTKTVLDLLRGALLAHIRPARGLSENLDVGIRLRLGLSGVLACWVAFASAGFGFYKTTEDQPFSVAGGGHPTLGGAHLAVEALAALASVAVLIGALPLIVIALRQAHRERGRLRVLVSLPVAAVILFATVTGLLVLIAHSEHGQHATAATHGAFIAWILFGLACGAVLVVAARNALFATPVARAWLVGALVAATLVTAAMLAIAAATMVYAVALPFDAPALAGEPNGPLQLLSVSISLVVQLIEMSVCGVLAMASARRAWRGIRTAAPDSS
ncbi:MAG: hypothetical protein ACRDK7_08520 [Solirubrobacteraceae bacterium]